MEYIIGLGIVVAVIAAFSYFAYRSMKKDMGQKEQWLAELPVQQLEQLKMADYQNYAPNPKLLTAPAIVTQVTMKNSRKAKIDVIFYNNVRRDYFNHYAFLEPALCENRRLKKGDYVQVLLSVEEGGMFLVKGIL